ncbi:Uncharacterised protein [Suttonella ornithocola]|uniref:Lipoprotein n=1 Tax=Suttonella ornithocola TaxID=279832 RepID=A0A380MXA9_9GAMM|nr:Uncharacterised protein [Suttonella ornithocola]
MRTLKKCWCLLLITACASKNNLLLPIVAPTAHEARWQIEQAETPSLVVAVPEGKNWRWVWTDALGIPIARQTLVNQKWEEDGLLPPNATAKALFTALMILDMSKEERGKVFPNLGMGISSTLSDVLGKKSEIKKSFHIFKRTEQPPSAFKPIPLLFLYTCVEKLKEEHSIVSQLEQQCSSNTTIELTLYPKQTVLTVHRLP